MKPAPPSRDTRPPPTPSPSRAPGALVPARGAQLPLATNAAATSAAATKRVGERAGEAARRRGQRRGRPSGSFTQHRRLDRLRAVLEANPRGLRLEELAVMLHVTTRSVRRYLKELSRLTELESVPLGPGSPHEWRIKPSERGRAVALRRTQAYGLLATRGLFDVFRGSALFDEFDIGLGMVATLAQRPTRGRAGGDIPLDQKLEERFLYAPFPARSYAGRGELTDELFRAVAECRETRLRLVDRAEPVDVEPYALVAHRGDLTCVVRDVASGRLEVHALEAIAEAVSNEKKRFVVPADFDLRAFLHGAFGVSAPGLEHRIIVEFDKAAAAEVRARKWHASQRIATAPDGRVRLSLVLPELEAVKRWILGFGPRARVVEPPELARALAADLKATLARYGA